MYKKKLSGENYEKEIGNLFKRQLPLSQSINDKMSE
jgi:hypothetical protein